MAPILSTRRFTVALPPEELWVQMGEVDAFAIWWPWLRHFDGDAPAEGGTWRCAVRPTGLYPVRFTVRFDEVVEAERLAASVSGDVVGWAVVDVAPDPAGSTFALTSSLEPRARLLRAVGAVAPAVARHGHDWVLTRAGRDFPGLVRSEPVA